MKIVHICTCKIYDLSKASIEQKGKDIIISKISQCVVYRELPETEFERLLKETIYRDKPKNSAVTSYFSWEFETYINTTKYYNLRVNKEIFDNNFKVIG